MVNLGALGLKSWRFGKFRELEAWGVVCAGFEDLGPRLWEKGFRVSQAQGKRALGVLGLGFMAKGLGFELGVALRRCRNNPDLIFVARRHEEWQQINMCA